MFQVVGKCRSPGATALGGEIVYFLCQPSHVCPAGSLTFPLSLGIHEAEGRLRRDGCVAGDRWTPGRSYWRRVVLLPPPATLSSPLPPLCSKGSEILDGLGSSVVSPCYPASGGVEKYRSIFSPSQHGVSFLPSVTQGRDCDINFSRRGAAALSTPPDVAASLLPVVAAPVRPGCRDLLHSAMVSGRLCQVRAARHSFFPNSVLEQLTGDPPCLGIKKQRVVNVVTDTWLATAGLRGGQILEARLSTFAASHTPLPSVSADPQGSEHRDGLGSSVVSLCYAVSGGFEEVSSYVMSLRPLFSFSKWSNRRPHCLSTRLQPRRTLVGAKTRVLVGRERDGIYRRGRLDSRNRVAH